MRTAVRERLPVFRLGLLTLAALAVHGYHLGTEDAEIYLPAAKKLLYPHLYPFADEFFLSHERLSLFSPILAWTARLTHLSMDGTIFLWYLVTLFATLAASWMLAAACFDSPRARWCSVLVITAVMTMPATNTGLLLMDPYLTARSFSTPLILVSLVWFLKQRYVLAALATAGAVTIHTQMTVWLVGLLATLWIMNKSVRPVRERVPVLASLVSIVPNGFCLTAAQGPYREALYARNFFFLSNWSWYHWLGMLAPLAILAWLGKRKLRGTTSVFTRLCLALIPFGLASILVDAMLCSSHTLDMFIRLQPLRCFHLITFTFVILLSGVVGEYATRDRLWAFPAIVVPLTCGMFIVARSTYPFSPQVEMPWQTASLNDWVNALLWVRHNTPEDAVFAIDSRYFKERGVDVHGFRSIAERSMLADYFKDGGAAAMFPNLADEWKQMSNATYGLDHFRVEDFARLAREYPITWTVIHGPAPNSLVCPYDQRGYAVCRVPNAPDNKPSTSVASKL